MNLLISGASGFIGSALCSHLVNNKHRIVAKTRQPKLLKSTLKGISKLSQLSGDETFDVVINLAGEPIANNRWSAKQKQKIVNSRIETTQEIIDFLTTTKKKPALFISGSALGYYGIGPSNDAVDESACGDDSFSSQLCTQWEACALQAEALNIRTCLLRIGIVLGKHGGALQKMLPPFKLGLGGTIGSGKQWMPWIHLNDLIRIIDYCIDRENISGPLNCTAPNPVTNAAFTKALGQHLQRPTLFHIPSIAIKLLMGQMGAELLLAGKKVLPAKLQQAGFQFQYQHIDSALSDIGQRCK